MAPLDLERPPERPTLPDPAPLDLRPQKWNVYTPDRLPEGDDWVIIGLTTKDYEILSLNVADIRRWIEEAYWRLQYYRGDQEISRELPLTEEQ